jgi:hypothetical protein
MNNINTAVARMMRPVRTCGRKFCCRCDNLLNLQTLSNPVRSKGRVQSGVYSSVVDRLGPGTVARQFHLMSASSGGRQALRPNWQAGYAEWLALIERRISAVTSPRRAANASSRTSLSASLIIAVHVLGAI